MNFSKNNIKNIIIIILAISIIAITYFFISTVKKDKKDYISNLSYPETKKYLENEGYNFSINDIDDLCCSNCTNDSFALSATIEKITYNYVIDFWDKSLEGNACCVTDTSANTNEDKKKQYDSYLKWKDEIGLNQEQIKEVLLKNYLDYKYDIEK